MRNDHRPYLLKRASATWNRWYAERFLYPQLDSVGEGCLVTNPRYFDVYGKNIRLGNDVHMMATRDNPVRLSTWPNGTNNGSIVVGDFCILLPGARITSASSVELGKNCMMASNSFITDADWHDLYNRTAAPGGSAPVVLEENVWVGDSVIVCKGVRIGANSVVGAGAVVRSDVPENVVVVGNPATIVKRLDPDVGFGTREKLFRSTVPYARMLDRYDREVLAENTFSRWFLSKWLPNRSL